MKLLGKTLYILSLIFILWIAISYVEITLENNNERPKYSEYNCFMVTMRIMEDFKE